jgi:hypothetical protein
MTPMRMGVLSQLSVLEIYPIDSDLKGLGFKPSRQCPRKMRALAPEANSLRR